jgi:hypothetical protein
MNQQWLRVLLLLTLQTTTNQTFEVSIRRRIHTCSNTWQWAAAVWKRPGPEANQWPPSIFLVNNEWMTTSTSPTRAYGEQRDNFTIILHLRPVPANCKQPMLTALWQQPNRNIPTLRNGGLHLKRSSSSRLHHCFFQTRSIFATLESVRFHNRPKEILNYNMGEVNVTQTFVHKTAPKNVLNLWVKCQSSSKYLFKTNTEILEETMRLSPMHNHHARTIDAFRGSIRTVCTPLTAADTGDKTIGS